LIEPYSLLHQQKEAIKTGLNKKNIAMLLLKYQNVESSLEDTRETTVCIENIVTVKDSIIVDISEELEEIIENMQRKKGTIINKKTALLKKMLK